MTQTRYPKPVLPADSTAAADEPLPGALARAIMISLRWAYEATLGQWLEGVAAVATGHRHDPPAGGAYLGRQIPATGYDQPQATGAAAPAAWASAYRTFGTSNTYTAPRYVDATLCPDVVTWQVLACVPLYLPAGCTGVEVVVEYGADLAGAGPNKMDLRVSLETAAGVQRDWADHQATASENVSDYQLPNALETGANSGAAWLAASATAGDPLAADEWLYLYMLSKPADNIVDASKLYLFGVEPLDL